MSNLRSSFQWSKCDKYLKNMFESKTSSQSFQRIHPRKLIWIPKMMVWKRWFLFNMATLGIYVRFLGGSWGILKAQTPHLNIDQVAQFCPRTSSLRFRSPGGVRLTAQHSQVDKLSRVGGRWHILSPNLQYIPLIYHKKILPTYIAFCGIICYLHLPTTFYGTRKNH